MLLTTASPGQQPGSGSNGGRTTINLNGNWQFDQTLTAFPPVKFTRTIMACYTPIEFPVTGVLKYGVENEILIKVGDRVWLPAEAAGGTGKVRVNRLLVLPSVAEKKVTVKAQFRNLSPAQVFYGDTMSDSVTLTISIAEKLSGKVVATRSGRFATKRDNLSEAIMDILFGMRDFTRKGKFFYLNGQKTILRGTNITLQRFFEDPDCGNLVWDKEWVKKLLVNYPKKLNWNAMRICVGIVPDFWYDLADEYGLLFQNEWLYWQNHGWDDQIRKEYTDWVWSDGSHPSIAIWVAGYMTSDQMALDEIDEPHPYQGPLWISTTDSENKPYLLGNLDNNPGVIRAIDEAGSAQLINEYGWIWLWRNGTPSKLTVDVYSYYLGKNSTPTENRDFQAYWMQLETEWLRSNPNVAGVLAFCYLANNYGYTGDWFIDNIKNLRPGPTLAWFRHAFAPVAAFINLTDERYVKHRPPHQPGSTLLFNLAGSRIHG